MSTGIEILAGIAILANAVIYGTDVFGAIVLCPAIGTVDDPHPHPDDGPRPPYRRSPHRAISIAGLIFTAATTALAAATGHWASTAAAAVGTVALISFAAVYTRVSKPVNKALTAAALADRVPGDARQLQARWDSVINASVVLQTVALAALCVALAAA